MNIEARDTRPVSFTTPIKSIIHDETRLLPFRRELWGKTLPMVVKADFDLGEWLRRIPDGDHINAVLTDTAYTLYHGRNRKLRIVNEEGVNNFDAYFGDSHGNWYHSLSIKGNSSTDPYSFYDGLGTDGYQVMGLCELRYVPRILHASELFRKNGIDTEWPVLIAKPAHFYIPGRGEPGTEDDVKKYAAENVFLNRQNPSLTAEEAVKDKEFVMIVRAMKMPYRLYDPEVMDEPEREALIDECISLHNFDVSYRKNKTDEADEPSSVYSYRDQIITGTPEGVHDRRRFYVTHVLPARIATNVARMHNLGVHHRYLHPGNLTLLGEIVDLDSPAGRSVAGYGKDATLINCMDDINAFISKDTINWVDGLFTTYKDPKNPYASILLEKDQSTTRKVFIKTYLAERGLAPDTFMYAAIANSFLKPKINLIENLLNDDLKDAIVTDVKSMIRKNYRRKQDRRYAVASIEIHEALDYEDGMISDINRLIGNGRLWNISYDEVFDPIAPEYKSLSDDDAGKYRRILDNMISLYCYHTFKSIIKNAGRA